MSETPVLVAVLSIVEESVGDRVIVTAECATEYGGVYPVGFEYAIDADVAVRRALAYSSLFSAVKGTPAPWVKLATTAEEARALVERHRENELRIEAAKRASAAAPSVLPSAEEHAAARAEFDTIVSTPTVELSPRDIEAALAYREEHPPSLDGMRTPAERERALRYEREREAAKDEQLRYARGEFGADADVDPNAKISDVVHPTPPKR